MSGTDVSAINSYPSSTEPAAMCDDGEHVVEADGRGGRECVLCGYSVQSLVDWWGHEVSR